MPKHKPTAATFEVFEMLTKRREFWWYVKDADGEIVDSWNRDVRYDEKAQEMRGSRAFASEDEARTFFASEYPTAVDVHATRDVSLPSEIAVDKARAVMIADDANDNIVDGDELERVRKAHAGADVKHLGGV